MIFNNRSHRRKGLFRYFLSLNIVAKFFVLFIMLAILNAIIAFISENTTSIVSILIIAAILILIRKPIGNAGKRFIDYRQFGNVNVSRDQLRALLSYLTPRQFEVFCSELFKALGNNVYLMPDGNDGGKDVIVNNKIYVECKRYNTNIIGREICQKLLGAVEADGMEKGIIFTNGLVNDNAKEMLAKTKRLELWNFDKIFMEFSSLENYKASLVLDTALQYKETSYGGLDPLLD